MSLAKLNEVLFENSDKIPEGLYLQLMNLSKGVFDENHEVIPRIPVMSVMPTTYTIYEMVKYGSRTRIGRGVYNDNREIALYAAGDRGTERFRLDLENNNMFQLLADGKDKKFFILKKINEYSIMFEIQTFTWLPTTRRYSLFSGVAGLTIARKERYSGDILPVDIRNRINLIFINYATQSVRTNWINCCNNLSDN